MVNSARGMVSGDGENGETGIRGYECPLCARKGRSGYYDAFNVEDPADFFQVC